MDVGAALGSIVSGGATGILGTLIGTVAHVFQSQQDRKTLEVTQKGQLQLAQQTALADAAKYAHELELQKLNMQAKGQETEDQIKVLGATTSSQLAVTELAKSWDGLQASMAAEASFNTANLPSWVNVVRAMVRPGLTGFLWCLYTAIAIGLMYNSLKWMVPADRQELLTYIVYNTIYTTSAITLWWFGDRAQKPKKLASMGKS